MRGGEKGREKRTRGGERKRRMRDEEKKIAEIRKLGAFFQCFSSPSQRRPLTSETRCFVWFKLVLF